MAHIRGCNNGITITFARVQKALNDPSIQVCPPPVLFQKPLSALLQKRCLCCSQKHTGDDKASETQWPPAPALPTHLRCIVARARWGQSNGGSSCQRVHGSDETAPVQLQRCRHISGA
jgi:hypothetical protein